MRRFVICAVLVLAACASNKTDDVPDPDFALTQLSRLPDVAEHVTGGIPVQYRLYIGNHATMPITLKTLNVQSVGMGAYDVPSTTRNFDVPIQPDKSAEVEFFVSAIAQTTILGANGPVTLHGIATFELGGIKFQKSFMVQANETQTQTVR